MSDEYVRKDLYDANMQSIRDIIAASEARHAQRIAESEARTDRQIAEIRSDVKEIHAQIASIKRGQDTLLGRAGIIVAIITLLYTAAPLVTSLIIAFKK